MSAIWRLGEADVKSVREVLSAEQPLAYTTVLTVLQRLTRQGLLTTRLEGRVGIYTPALSETEYLERVLAEELDLVSNEAGCAVLTAALERLAANRSA